MVSDNVRPYVDHDLPFDGVAMRERHENGAIDAGQQRRLGALRHAPSAIMKGPTFMSRSL